VSMSHEKTWKIALSALVGLVFSAVVPVGFAQSPPSNVRMTWYGITNWHYQIGDVGVSLDGESVNGALSAASVTKQLPRSRKKAPSTT